MITERVGIAHVRISGDNRYRLLNALIKSNISIMEMTDAGEAISGNVDLTKLRRLERYCRQYNAELEVTDEKGIVVKSRRYYKHYGILAGIIVSLAIMLYLSNIVLHIRIIGADYETRQDILAILEDFDIEIGMPVSDINFYQLETSLMKDTDSIAWAGIRRNGSEIVINVSQIKQKPDMTQNRYPASIIATRDAVITGFLVYSGSIDFMIGDAVAKGQILISGEYTDADGNYKYRYSQASITGRFVETQTFFEPFEDTQKIVYENAEQQKFFRFFDADINPFSENMNGRYIEHSDIKYWQFLGLDLPIGVTNVTYDSYEYVTVTRDEQQLREAIDADIEIYETNFLSDCEILDKDVKYRVSDDGITATVIYVAEGEIGETKLIFPESKYFSQSDEK